MRKITEEEQREATSLFWVLMSIVKAAQAERLTREAYNAALQTDSNYQGVYAANIAWCQAQATLDTALDALTLPLNEVL